MNNTDLQTQITQLEEKITAYEEVIASLQADVEAETEQTKRVLADLENFRRREGENKKNWSEDAVAKFLKAFLPQFLALHLGSKQSEDKDLVASIEAFMKSIEKEGLTQVNPETGTKVDPNLHEVVMVAEGEAGTIAEVFEPGWKYKDTLISPAKVSGVPQS